MPPKKKTAKKETPSQQSSPAGKKATTAATNKQNVLPETSPSVTRKQTGRRVATTTQASSANNSAAPSPSSKNNNNTRINNSQRRNNNAVDDSVTKNELAKTHATELWENLKLTGIPVNAVADQMVNKTIAVILQDVDAAVAALLTLVCKGAGLEESLDASRVGDTSNAANDVSELIARVPNDMQNFPLSEKACTTSLGRRFRRIYAAFWEQLPKTIYAQSLDEYTTNNNSSPNKKNKKNNNKNSNSKKSGKKSQLSMLDSDDDEDEDEDDQQQTGADGGFLVTIMPWLGLLSDAKARNFRMSASVAMFSYIQGSSKVLVDLDKSAANTMNQRENALRDEQIDLLRQRIDEMFSASFHVRTRDVASDIRLTAFQCLHSLIQHYPSLFLTNRHIRYFGVALNDKRVEIRIEALETILSLLDPSNENVADHINKLTEFLRYFSGRIVEMKDDVESRCVDLSLKTAFQILGCELKANANGSCINLESIDKLLFLVTDDRLKIRRTAGKLLRIIIRFKPGQEDMTEKEMHFVTSLCHFSNSLRTMYDEKMPEKYIIDALIGEDRPLGLSEFELDALIQIAKHDPESSSSNNNTQSQQSQSQSQKKKGGNNKKSGKSSQNNNQDAAAAIPDFSDADVAAAIRLLCAVFTIYNAATSTDDAKLAKNPSQIFFGPPSKDDLRSEVPKMDNADRAEIIERLTRETATSVLKTALANFPESEVVHAAVVEALSIKTVVGSFSLRNSGINEIINIALKQPTLNGPVSRLDSLAQAWQSLGTVDSSGLKDIASSALQQLTKADSTRKNLSSSSNNTTGKKGGNKSQLSQSTQNVNVEQALQAANLLGDSWARVSMLSGVTNLTAQWAIFETGLLQQSVANVVSSSNNNEDDANGGNNSVSAIMNSFDPRIASYMVQGAYSSILWAVHEASANLQEMLETAIPRIASIVRKMTIAVANANENSGSNNNNNNNIAGYGVGRGNNNTNNNNNGNDQTSLVRLQVTTLCALLDILSLPLNFNLDNKEVIEPFIFALSNGIETACDCQRRVASALESRGGAGGAGAANALSILRNNNLRRDRVYWEAILTRLCAGFARVIVFSRLADAASQNELETAAKVMRTWTKVSSCCKAAGEIMKQLFHTIREQRLAESPTSDVGAIDKAILQAAYDNCINNCGGSSTALEEFHAVGVKLAMMHMPFSMASTANSGTITAAERFYPAVPGVVELGIDLAASDDIFLHAVIPYCNRLKQPHARSLIDVLAQNEFFSPDGQGVNSSYARAFVAALRRAAKLDGAAAASGSNASVFATNAGSVAVGRVNNQNQQAGTASVSAAPKRQIKLGGNALNAPTEDENDMFNQILRSKVAGSRRGRPSATTAEIQDANNNNNNNNNMMMMNEAPSPVTNNSNNKQKKSNNTNNNAASSPASTGKKGAKKVVISATQQSNDTNYDDDDEMMLATQEWN